MAFACCHLSHILIIPHAFIHRRKQKSDLRFVYLFRQLIEDNENVAHDGFIMVHAALALFLFFYLILLIDKLATALFFPVFIKVLYY
jgi:hypothetical protein